MEKKCYLCGSTENLTADHIPPKSLFPKPRPNNLITVPCCLKCNNSLGRDDELFCYWLSLNLTASPSAMVIWEQVSKKAFGRSQALAKAFADSLKKVPLQTPEGVVEMDAISVPANRVERVLERLAKGFLFKFYPDFDYAGLLLKLAVWKPCARCTALWHG